MAMEFRVSIWVNLAILMELLRPVSQEILGTAVQRDHGSCCIEYWPPWDISAAPCIWKG